MTFTVTLADGKRVTTCCPKCGLLFAAQQQQPPRGMTASDLVTGTSLDAHAATYVIGSDVSHCATLETRRDAYGCCYVKNYDRCQPSVVAFAQRDEASKFQRTHGGQLITFAELVSKQTSQPINPGGKS